MFPHRWNIACSAGVFFERSICSRKRHVETSRREEEMGRVKGSTYRKGYYFYSPQSSTVIKSKMAAYNNSTNTNKIRLHCRLDETLRRELKIRRAAEYFWRTLRCFIQWWNTLSNAWYYFSNKTILEVEIKDAKLNSFSSDFQTLIKL